MSVVGWVTKRCIGFGRRDLMARRRGVVAGEWSKPCREVVTVGHECMMALGGCCREGSIRKCCSSRWWIRNSSWVSMAVGSDVYSSQAP